MKVIASNRRARYDYEITETLIAGVVLTGAEVKSVKNGHISLKGAYVTVKDGELYLINAHISPYKYAAGDYEEIRDRKLLVRSSELERLIGHKQNGIGIVPMAVGIERGLVKIEIGFGRGQKKHDKREVIKKREAARDVQKFH